MRNPLRLTFVLPCPGQSPIGGFRVIYEYANRLAAAGHAVSVVHDMAAPSTGSIRNRIGIWRAWRGLRQTGAFRPDRWFCVDRRVRMLLVPSLRPRYIPDADVVVATAWQTAEHVVEYPLGKGRKLYFVQDYEFYMTADRDTRDRMVRTYQSGMMVLASTAVVREILAANGVTAPVRVPIGIDFTEFFRELATDSPSREGVVAFPARGEAFKRTEDAIAALDVVRGSYSGRLRVHCFGSRRIAVPDWVEFRYMLDPVELRSFYNHTAVLVLPSLYEGFGLPGAEAMACGVALACTDSGGVREYAVHEETALLSPPREPGALADSVLRLLQDKPFRVGLAERGARRIRAFTWSGAVAAFEEALAGAALLPPQTPEGCP